jgi:hypothetical protein
MSDTSAVPNNSLTIVNPAPPPGVTNAPSNRFLLFTDSWLDLQNYVEQALQMPITTNDFNQTYGSFPDEGLIKKAVGALKDVRALSLTFGDPVLLKGAILNDPNYLNGVTPPKEIYAHIVWLANQIYNASTTYTFTFSALQQLLSVGSPEERAANLKMVLVGEGGLVSTATDMKTKTNLLLSKLLTFDSDITAANDIVKTYVGQGSAIIGTAEKIIGSTTANINDVLRPAADKAYKAWRDYTISAVTTSVGLMVLSAGMLFPVALGLGIGLGVAASLQRKAYDDLLEEISVANVDIQKKTRLVSDLKGFNTSMNLVAPALSTFKTNLEIIEGVWVGIGANLSFIANNFGVDQLSSYPWVMQAMKIGDAQAKWQAIGATAQQFTGNALVSYNFGTKWGEQIPAAA